MRLAIVVAGIGLLYGWPALAQPPQTPPAPAPMPPAATATPSAAPTIPLSLEEAVLLGIENNTDVELLRFDPPIADYELMAAWGAYDPNLFGEYTYTSTNLPVASTFFPDQFIERASEGEAGLAGLVPKLGWSYEIAYAGNGTATNSLIQTLGTTYTSSLTASLVAPLLKGAFWGDAWTQVELTGIGTGIALEQFRLSLMDIVRSIEDGYWNVAATRQELEVANRSLDTARALLDQVKAQYEVGVVSRVEVVEAEAGVADREFRQITARTLYRQAQDELIDRVYGPRLTPTTTLEIEELDRPEDFVRFALDPEASTQRAMERRPELEIAHDLVEQSVISLQFAKNQRLPQLDLVGSYGTNGLAGNDPNCPFTRIDPTTGDCTITPTQPDGIGRDYADNDSFWWKGNKNRVWVGGALFSIPIPNRTGRANVGISELELRKAKTNVVRVEQDIVKEVRQAVRNLEAALQGVEAAVRNVEFSNEQLRAERIRLEHGESTPFDVLQRVEDLSEAESQRIAALRVYRGSVTALDRAQGTLLEDRGIVLEDALTLR